MTVHLRTPREAFAAVAWLVCSADKRGSSAEFRFLYEQVQGLAIFQGCDRVEFQQLLGTTFSKLFQALPTGELTIPEDQVKSLIAEIRALLSPELQVEAYKMAEALAAVDTVCTVEATILARLRDGLAIDEARLMAL